MKLEMNVIEQATGILAMGYDGASQVSVPRNDENPDKKAKFKAWKLRMLKNERKATYQR